VTGNNRDRRTDDDEERLRQLVLANTPPFQIAEALGRTESAVKARAHSLGITLRFWDLDAAACRNGAEGEK
jgi:hypothetical protein